MVRGSPATEILGQMLNAPLTHWMRLALVAGMLMGCLAWLPLIIVSPGASKLAFGLIWLAVAAPVAVLVGIRLERFAHGSGNANRDAE